MIGCCDRKRCPNLRGVMCHWRMDPGPFTMPRRSQLRGLSRCLSPWSGLLGRRLGARGIQMHPCSTPNHQQPSVSWVPGKCYSIITSLISSAFPPLPFHPRAFWEYCRWACSVKVINLHNVTDALLLLVLTQKIPKLLQNFSNENSREPMQLRNFLNFRESH